MRSDDAGSPFSVRLFGPFEVLLGGQPLSRLSLRKSPAVLAMLALRQGGEVERDWLAGLLWPDSSQPSALHSLRNCLTDLRRALGPEAVRLRSPAFRTLALDLTGAAVDVLAFDAALARGDPLSLAEAVALYRGPLLEGYVEEWAFQERQPREQAYLTALERLAALALAGEETATAEGYLRRAVAVDPLRESTQRALMAVLAGSGNYASALLCYRELRLRLHRELNAEPDPETCALFERLRAEARRLHERPAAPACSGLTWPPALTPEISASGIPASIADRAADKERPSVSPAVKGERAQRRSRRGLGRELPAAPAPGPARDEGACTARSLDPRGPAARPGGNLPRRLTRFFGREAEIERLCGMLWDADTPLVTLTGPGGSGKTSLALETARRLQSAAADETVSWEREGAEHSEEVASGGPVAGRLLTPTPASQRFSNWPRTLDCWFVPLLDLADPRLILDKVHDVLRLPRSPLEEPLEQIVAFLSAHDPLRRHPALLVLDNFEHLVEGGVEVVRTLLERVAGLTVLGTSRRRLDLPGEREFPVAPLPVPGARCPGLGEGAVALGTEHQALSTIPSVALFVDRAQAVRPDFQVTVQNAAAVADLCQRLEGLPLAIELAAARAGVLTPQQMLARLESTLPSGAAARSAGNPPTSWVPGAATQGGGRFELLAGRQRSANPRHRSLRATLDWSYQLLAPELQRFFARLSIFRGGWTLEAAAAVCVDLVLDAGPRTSEAAAAHPSAVQDPKCEIQNANGLEYLEELQRCSLVVTEAVGEEMRYRLLETLREYGAERLSAEERTALAQRHLAYFRAWIQNDQPGVVRWTLKQRVDKVEREQDNVRAALDWWVQSGRPPDWILQIEDSPLGILRLLPTYFWQVRGSAAEGRQRLAEILALPGAAAPTMPRAFLLSLAGRLARQQGDFAAADALLQESLAIYQGLGHKAGELGCWQTLARVARDRGDYAGARPFDEQSLAIAREAGYELEVACALGSMGYTAYLEGDLGTAQSLLDEALRILRKEPEFAWTRAHPGLAVTVSDDDWAYMLLEAIAGIGAHLAEVADARGDHAAARAYLEESLALYPELGQLRSAAYARHKLGRVAQHQGQWSAAAAHFSESLAFWQQDGNKQGIAACLEGLAAVAGGRGEPERAARLLGAAAALRESRNIPFPPVERADQERVIAAVRAGLDEQAFAAAWAEGQTMSIDQTIAEALQAAPMDGG